MGEIRVWHTLITQFRYQFGDDKHFVGVVAKLLFQLVQIVVIHRNQIIKMLKITGFDFAALKTRVVDAQVGQNFGCAHVHVFAIVPTLRARTVHCDVSR